VCYLVAGGLDVLLTEAMVEWEPAPNFEQPNPTEPFLIRLFLIWLLSACVYGVQVLFEKQRRAEEEAREFAARQAQLQAAGRVAAEVAHQLKNPLGIINTTAWSLRKALNENRPIHGQQVDMIREEVDRCDRIITQVMGFARLAEGRVEKLNVAEAIDRAVAEVFPKGLDFELEVSQDVAPGLPPLVMQRVHLSEVLNNLLQNAREAIGRRGRVEIAARADADEAIIISVRDSGPGIPRSQLDRIFEPYFTTKAKGSGLGLPLIKRNTEMYGGTVRVESDLGKGAVFTLHFPTKIFMRPKS
jgi:signal transduction histidine kinase